MAQRGQEKRLAEALHKLAAEDPSLAIEQDPQTQDTVLRGLGELHLRSVLERLRGDMGVDVETRAPRIPYRETVTRAADGHCRHKKQTGGAGQFGEVRLKIEPLARGAGFEFVDETVGGSIPGQYIPAVEKGVREVLRQGAVTGNPMQDLRVVVYDGKHHPVDSKEVAFIAAGRKAFLDAVGKAAPVVLEPIARIEVTLPGRAVGDVSGRLAGIRGRITGNETAAGNRVLLTAEVPLAELADFQTTLKSLTGGECRFSLKLDHYDPAPAAVQKSLEAEWRPQPDS
jgi:elongation factor G